MRVISGAVTAVLLAATSASAQAPPVFLRAWQVAGPFPNPDDAGLDTAYPPESREFPPPGPFPGAEGPVAWKAVASPTDYIDLVEHVGKYEQVVAYAAARVVSPEDQDVLLMIGSDDGVKAWLNGAEVHRVRERRAAKADQDKVKARLRRGVNQILLKIEQGPATWGFFFRIADRAKNGLEDLECLPATETLLFELEAAPAYCVGRRGEVAARLRNVGDAPLVVTYRLEAAPAAGAELRPATVQIGPGRDERVMWAIEPRVPGRFEVSATASVAAGPVLPGGLSQRRSASLEVLATPVLLVFARRPYAATVRAGEPYELRLAVANRGVAAAEAVACRVAVDGAELAAGATVSIAAGGEALLVRTIPPFGPDWAERAAEVRVEVSAGDGAPATFIFPLVVLPPATAGGAGDADTYEPGLVARYYARDPAAGGAVPLVTRLEPDVNHVWGFGAPHRLLDPASFAVVWTGRLQVKERGEYRFSWAAGEGDDFALRLDGRPVADAASLSFGYHAFEVRYVQRRADARVRLFWESETIPREPVPHQVFFHTPEEAREAGPDLIERGRALAERLGCANCHDIPGLEPARTAPRLDRAAGFASTDWLRGWLADPAKLHPGAEMPRLFFGDEKQVAFETAAVAAWLAGIGGAPPPEPPAGDAANGRALTLGLGCVACHRVPGVEGTPPDGRDLAGVGSRYTGAKLHAFLREPHAFRPSRRMPDFRLTEAEAADVAAFLAGLTFPAVSAPPAPPADELRTSAATVVKAGPPGAATGDVVADAGAALAARKRCAACHEPVGGLKAEKVLLFSDREGGGPISPHRKLEAGCLRPVPGASDAPWYLLSALDRASLAAFLGCSPITGASLDQAVRTVGPTGPPVAHLVRGPDSLFPSDELRGARLYERLQCGACHTRSGGGREWARPPAPALDADGDSVPPPAAPEAAAAIAGVPDLSAAGRKLQFAWLYAFLQDPAERSRPWLKVRMPDFRLTPDEAALLSRHLARKDRLEIPEKQRNLDYENLDGNPRLFTAGDQGLALAGKKGFSCFSCHLIRGKQVGTTESALDVAPDLTRAGARLRNEWFLEWLRDPQRFLPGARMPAIGPVHGGEAMRSQLWNYLVAGAPGAETSLSETTSVRAGADAALPTVVYGVVYPSAENNLPRHYPRGLLFIFPNQSAFLFDAQALGAAAWWREGDFAYKVEGRLRYWQPAKPAAWSGEGRIELHSAAEPQTLALRVSAPSGTPGRFGGYRLAKDAVALDYKLAFEDGTRTVEIGVTETISGVALPQAGTGWAAIHRDFVFDGLPEGFTLRYPLGSGTVGPSSSRVTGEGVEALTFVAGGALPWFLAGPEGILRFASPGGDSILALRQARDGVLWEIGRVDEEPVTSRPAGVHARASLSKSDRGRVELKAAIILPPPGTAPESLPVALRKTGYLKD